MTDPEIAAMAAVADALAVLNEDERGRVLDWARRRFGAPRPPAVEVASAGSLENERNGDVEPDYAAFVDLFDAASPRTEPERALVGGYWFQVIQGMGDFPSQSVNEALKDVGHGASNITDALTKLQRRKPSLARQVAKSGKTRQARKKYKLTSAGLAEVRRMLEGRDE